MANITVNCAWCKNPFQARSADIKRGWGKFCSKSCKACNQESRTSQFATILQREREPDWNLMEQWEREDSRFESDMDCHPFSEDAFS